MQLPREQVIVSTKELEEATTRTRYRGAPFRRRAINDPPLRRQAAGPPPSKTAFCLLSSLADGETFLVGGYSATMQRVQLALVKVAADRAAGPDARRCSASKWQTLDGAVALQRQPQAGAGRNSALKRRPKPCRGPIFGTQITP